MAHDLLQPPDVPAAADTVNRERVPEDVRVEFAPTLTSATASHNLPGPSLFDAKYGQILRDIRGNVS